MNDDLNERVARLEQRMNNVEALGVKVDRLSDEWARYRGFVGGVMLVVTSVSAFFAAGLRGWFMGHWR